MALIGMSTAGKGMDSAERKRAMEALVTESSPLLQDYVDGSGLAFELSTNLAIARA
jgi:hypothetical protein